LREHGLGRSQLARTVSGGDRIAAGARLPTGSPIAEGMRGEAEVNHDEPTSRRPGRADRDKRIVLRGGRHSHETDKRANHGCGGRGAQLPAWVYLWQCARRFRRIQSAGMAVDHRHVHCRDGCGDRLVLHLSQELDALQCKENALAIFNQRFIPEDASLDEMVKRRLGLGDEWLRQEVTDALRGAYLDARLLERADRNYRDAQAELINMDQCSVGGKAGIAEIDVLRTVRAAQERKFLTGARRVNELAHTLSERIARYRTRSIRFRSEMERFFERPILNE
jgi:hypothetical protein